MSVPVKFKLNGIFYENPAESDEGTIFSEELDIEGSFLKFKAFAQEIRDNGILESFEKKYTQIYIDINTSNKHYVAFEFSFLEECSREDFDALFLKFKALLTQNGFIK